MLGKVKVSSALMFTLVAFFALQLITQSIGFWSFSRNHDDVILLSNIAISQIDAVNETAQHLMDARINLARASTRMAHGAAEPVDLVNHVGPPIRTSPLLQADLMIHWLAPISLES
ncbi:MAG: Tar ligand binding domain-containing protein [Paraburkholderia tropica]|uniref:Tar-like ligand binding protein n=1 Tax=Paraburkholderia tropica TaxID=92647 RepID=A0ABX5MJ10_9BURK|nr:Tar ligand binding domain-containing protein [Paraburkholderia tropica]PXX12556.1 Tar-like ligand binding protein [Paraburkholderia tropica]PZW76533.1 Tar-like ligand binding protein [Paraburkholderia tropica]